MEMPIRHRSVVSKILLGVAAVGLSTFALHESINFLSYSTYRISGEVRQVRITSSGRGKQWHPDWLPFPSLGGGNYDDVPSYCILRVEHDGKTDEFAMYLEDGPKIPGIGERVDVEVKRFGVYKPLTGEEPTFSDGVPNLNHSRSYPVIKRITSLQQE